MNSQDLNSVWEGLPEDPCVAYFGGDIALRGKRIAISHFSTYTETEKLEALKNLIPNKHCLVIAPSSCGSYVPVSQMAPEDLILAATKKANIEPSAIIGGDLLPVFREFETLLTDVDPSVAAQALEELQDMVFDQSLRQLSKGALKYCFVYVDNLLDGLVMVLGNRKILSFDLKKVKALHHKLHDLIDAASTPSKTAPKKKPKTKAPPASESESSTESESSYISEGSSSQEDGLVPEGKMTPVLSRPASPVVPPVPASSPLPIVSALLFAKNKAAAEAALLEAQQRVASLAAAALAFQAPPPPNQLNGPAFKAPSIPTVVIPPPVSCTPGYTIPKKAAASEELSARKSNHKHHRKHSSHSSGKLNKSSRHSNKLHKAKKAAKKVVSGTDASSSVSASESSSSEVVPPPIDDETAQVLCSVLL